MSKKESFLLRIDAETLEQIKRWAAAELRSTNAHIEYLLRRSLKESGHSQATSTPSEDEPS